MVTGKVFMLYHIGLLLQNYCSYFNVIHYVSFRAIAALFTAYGSMIICGPLFIKFSQRFLSSAAREYTPESHKLKGKIPSMGGLLIVGVTIGVTLLWTNLYHLEVWLGVLCFLGFGLLGFLDDWSKIRYRKGISERHKFWGQVIISFLLAWAWYFLLSPAPVICFPFFKHVTLPLGIFFIAWAMLVMIATSNAVNLTDGLDGLAISSLIMNFATFGLIAYIAGHYTFAHYLHIPFVHTAEISIVCATLVGASLGFLWYNAYPAALIMGDVGALSLGGFLGFIALLTKQELLLLISGGLFVIEALSVMIQVAIFKRSGIRFFRMAPLHHHFELVGWHESTIMIRFCIITFLLCLLTLLTLKLR